MPVERTKSLYARTLHEIVYIRRYTGSGAAPPFFDTQARARMMSYTPEQLIIGGVIQQGDRKAIVFVPDLVAAEFALPVTSNDWLVVRGKAIKIIAVDDNTRRDDAELIALEIQVRG